MPMRHFCTLFDSFYLTRGLAMYQSLKRKCPDFHLYIFPFDEKSMVILEALKLKNVTLVPLADFEDQALLEVKKTRTKGEYCWTCTPATISYCINKFKLESCTYIDADLYFFFDPAVLIDEMGGKSILITEHRYTKRYDRSATSGIYCVQFITFKNDEQGMKALNWWQERCLEWCYDRKEDGKFGDQKYLDDWTERFEGVHVLKHLGGGVAPWNIQQYHLVEQPDGLYVGVSSHRIVLVFFHFHFLKFYANDRIDLGDYQLTTSVINRIYRPYLRELVQIESMLAEKFQFERRIQKYFYKNLAMTQVHRLGRILLGVFNVYSLNKITNGETNKS